MNKSLISYKKSICERATKIFIMHPVGWHMPRCVTTPEFWENIYIRGPGSLFQGKCFYGEGSKGHPKTHLGASNSTRYSRYGLVKFQFSTERRTDQKSRFPAIFWHFSNFDVFLKGNPGQASKNPSGTSQIAMVPEIWPPEVSISLENTREGQTKTAIFSTAFFGF